MAARTYLPYLFCAPNGGTQINVYTAQTLILMSVTGTCPYLRPWPDGSM